MPVVAIVCANYSWLVRGRGRGRDGEVAGGVGNDKGAEGAGNDKGDGGAGGTEGTEGTGGVWFGRGVVPVSGTFNPLLSLLLLISYANANVTQSSRLSQRQASPPQMSTASAHACAKRC